MTEDPSRFTKENGAFNFSGNYQKIFDSVKTAIVDFKTLALCNPQEKCNFEVDASTKGLGACLMQRGRPVSFASKSLAKTESNYSNTEREYITVVFGL